MTPEQETELLRQIESPEGPDANYHRWAAILELGGSKSERAFATLVRIFTTAADARSRERALMALARTGDPRADVHLVAGLTDAEDRIRMEAVSALVDRPIPAAADALIAMLQDQDALVRSNAARALGGLRHAAAVPALAALTRDPDGMPASSAMHALAAIGTPEANEVLLADHVDPGYVWDHLMRLGDARALPKMRAYLTGGGHLFLEDVLRGLVVCGEPSLEKFASDWAARHRKVLRPKRKAPRWGEGVNDPAASEKSEAVDRETLATLKSIGWLDEVPPREAARIKRALRGEEGPEGPSMLASWGYDAECIENDGDYKRVFAAYQKASFGTIKFTKIADVIDHENLEATISFVANGRPFRTTFLQEGDFVADGFHAYMNKVAATLGEKKRFYQLDTGDQTVALAFVTPRTHARARKAGLV